MNTSWTNPSDKLDLDEICDLLQLPKWGDIDELNQHYYFEVADAVAKERLADDATEEDREKAVMDAEQEARDEVFANWHQAIMCAVERVFSEHGLALEPCRVRRKVPDHPWQFRVRPIMPHGWWSHAADCIRDTINGVGYFHFNTLKEFLESGPYTPRKAVLSHLQWMKDRARVYGDTSAKSIYEGAWRR